MAKLGAKSVGSVIKLNVNGTPMNFIIVHQGNPDTSVYDSSFDDSTWLLMEDVYTTGKFISNNNHYYNLTNIHAYLNNTFVNLLDSNIIDAVKTVNLPCIYASGTAYNVSSRIFPLSYTEVGFSGDSYSTVTGAVLSYFKNATPSQRVGYLSGIATQWWLRSWSVGYNNHAWTVNTSGAAEHLYGYNAFGIRPALILSSKLFVNSNGDITDGGINGCVGIDGSMKDLTGEGYVNVNGTWKSISKSYVNVNGVWKLC